MGLGVAVVEDNNLWIKTEKGNRGEAGSIIFSTYTKVDNGFGFRLRY